MSYNFTSKWYRDRLMGMGSTAYIGPDQPWTAANASQWITQRTRQCEAGKEIVIGGLTPPKYVGGDKVLTESCYATGRVKESAKAGYQRVQEWCCPVSRIAVPVTKQLTQAQADQYATTCTGRSLSLPSGQTVALDLGYWLYKSANVPSAMCQDSGIMDGDYRLLCCNPNKSTLATVVKDGKVYVAGGISVSESAARTADQIANATAAEAVQAAEDEVVLVASQEPQYGFFQRYGLVLALGAGAIGIGVFAGLLKRRHSTKSEE
jgi:hypothetical protein